MINTFPKQHNIAADYEISGMFQEITAFCAIVSLSLLFLVGVLLAIAKYRRPSRLAEPQCQGSEGLHGVNTGVKEEIPRKLDPSDPSSCRLVLDRALRNELLSEICTSAKDVGGELATCMHEIHVATVGIGKLRKDLSSDIHIALQIIEEVLEMCFSEINTSTSSVSDRKICHASSIYKSKETAGEVLELETCLKRNNEINNGIPQISQVLIESLGEVKFANRNVRDVTNMKRVCQIKSAMLTIGNICDENLIETNCDRNENSLRNVRPSSETCLRGLIAGSNDAMISSETYQGQTRRDEHKLSYELDSSKSNQIPSEINDKEVNDTNNPDNVEILNHVLVRNALPNEVVKKEFSEKYPPNFHRELNRFAFEEGTEHIPKCDKHNFSREILVANTDFEKYISERPDPVDHAANIAEKHRATLTINSSNYYVNEKVEEWVKTIHKMFSPTIKKVGGKAECQDSFLTNILADEKYTPDLRCKTNHETTHLVDNKNSDAGLRESESIHIINNYVDPTSVTVVSESTRLTDLSAGPSQVELETNPIGESRYVEDHTRKTYSDEVQRLESYTNTAIVDVEKEEVCNKSSISSIIEESISLLRDFIDTIDSVAVRVENEHLFRSVRGESSYIANEKQEYEVTFDNSARACELPPQLRSSSSLFEMLHMKETVMNDRTTDMNGKDCHKDEISNRTTSNASCGQETRKTKSFIDPTSSKLLTTMELSSTQGYSSSFGSPRSAYKTGGNVFKDYWSFRKNFDRKMCKIIAKNAISCAMSEKMEAHQPANQDNESISQGQHDTDWIECMLSMLVNNIMDITEKDTVKFEIVNETMSDNIYGEPQEFVLKEGSNDIGRGIMKTTFGEEPLVEADNDEKIQSKIGSCNVELSYEIDFSLKHIDSVDLSRKSFEMSVSRSDKEKTKLDNSSSGFGEQESVFSLKKHRDSVEILCRKSFDSAKRKSFVEEVTKSTFGQNFGMYRTCLNKSSGSLGHHRDSVELLCRDCFGIEVKENEGDTYKDACTVLAKHIDSVELLGNRSTGTNILYSKQNIIERTEPREESFNRPNHLCWDLNDSISYAVPVVSQSSKQGHGKHIRLVDETKTLQISDSASELFSQCQDDLDENAPHTSTEQFSTQSSTSVDEGLLDDNQSPPKGILKLNKVRANVRSVSWKDLKNQVESHQSFSIDESEPCLVLEAKGHHSSILDSNSALPTSGMKAGCSNGVGSLIRLFNGTKAFNGKRKAETNEAMTGDNCNWDLRQKLKESEDVARNSAKITDDLNPAEKNEVLLTCQNLSEQLLAMTENSQNVREQVTHLESYYDRKSATDDDVGIERSGI